MICAYNQMVYIHVHRHDIIIRKWEKEMDNAIDGLKRDLISEVDKYIKDTLQKWVIYEVSVSSRYYYSSWMLYFTVYFAC